MSSATVTEIHPPTNGGVLWVVIVKTARRVYIWQGRKEEGARSAFVLSSEVSTRDVAFYRPIRRAPRNVAGVVRQAIRVVSHPGFADASTPVGVGG